MYHLCAIDQSCRPLVWVKLRGWIFEIEFLRKLIIKQHLFIAEVMSK